MADSFSNLPENVNGVFATVPKPCRHSRPAETDATENGFPANATARRIVKANLEILCHGSFILLALCCLAETE